jgi:hypothetical protein
MLRDDFEFILRFVLEQAELQPLERRPRIYRALATICGDEWEARQLRRLADALENASVRRDEFQMALDARRGTMNEKGETK